MNDFNVKLAEDKGETGKLQRLRIDVPKPQATLQLGQRYTDDPAFGYHGLSFRTEANFFVDVTKTTLFQGHAGITFQTTANWTQYATGMTIVYAKDTADVTSARSVRLFAVPADGHDPAVGADMKPVDGGDEIEAVASYDDVRDDFIGTQNDAIDTWKSVASLMNSAKQDLGDSGFQKTEVTDESDEARALLASLKSDSSDKSGDTHAGIALASKDSVAVYSPATVVNYAGGGHTFLSGNNDAQKDFDVLSSANIVARAGAKAEVFAAAGAAFESGTTTEVTGVGAVSFASRGGEASVLGKSVFIGTAAPGDRLGAFANRDASKQTSTETVTVKATKTATIDSDKEVLIQAASKVTMLVGSFKVTIEGSGMKVGNLDGQTFIEIKDDEIKMTAGPQSLQLSKSGGVAIEGTGDGVVLKSGGSQVKTASDSVSVRGGQIKLG